MRVLLQHAEGGVFVEDLFDSAVARAKLSPPDRRLAQELIYGVVRNQATLDWLIAHKTNGRPQQAAVQNLVRLGLYQLFWLDRVPVHAAVNETVELAKQIGHPAQASFVNAVLRRYSQEFAATRQQLAELKQVQPHLGHSHPLWLVERWSRRWGRRPLQDLLEWNNTPPRTFARVNSLKTDARSLLERWRMEERVDYDFVRHPWLAENAMFELTNHPKLGKLKSFRDGGFYIQDPSTLLAVQELDPQPGERVLDLCAAPGGKTTVIAARMNNTGQIIAVDQAPDRLALVTENCARLGVTCVLTRLATAKSWATGPEARFDRVLIDAPCSNTGVLRRRVDLRWRVTEPEILRLRAAQLDLLRLAAPLLKPGGTLIYSTCSLEPEENAEVVKEFLAATPTMRLEAERELLPFRDLVDGAYVARLRRAAG